jgi:integrase
MARRASGEGNIRKRSDGRWEGRYVAGHDEYGKPIRKSVLGKSQAEVRDKLRQAIELSQGLDVAKADTYTVETWLKTWFELYAKPNIRETTQRSYKGIIEMHIIPYIGNIMLTKLTTRDIQKMYNDLRTNGNMRAETKDKNPGLSSSYVRSVHMVLHNCLDRAVKERLLTSNPTENCIIPKLEKKEMKILQPEDMTAYLKEANKREVLPMFFLELCTGLRKGELVALLWEDLNMERKTIRVNKQAIGVKGGGVKVTRPKTETSIRTVSIPQEAIDLLIQEHQKHPDNPYMFPSPVTGGMYYPDAITRLHTKILDSAGIEHIRFHDMRHTFATTALQNGIDIRTVSGMLGHFDAGFTLRTYTHVTNSVQEQAANTMGSVMSQHI